MTDRIWGYQLLERMPPGPRTILERICAERGLNPVNVLGPNRTPIHVAARKECWTEMRQRFQRNEIAAWFNMSPPKIRYARPQRLEAAE